MERISRVRKKIKDFTIRLNKFYLFSFFICLIPLIMLGYPILKRNNIVAQNKFIIGKIDTVYVSNYDGIISYNYGYGYIISGNNYYDINPDLSTSKDFKKGDEILLAYNEEIPSESVIMHKEIDVKLYIKFVVAALIEVLLIYLLFRKK